MAKKIKICKENNKLYKGRKIQPLADEANTFFTMRNEVFADVGNRAAGNKPITEMGYKKLSLSTTLSKQNK